MITLPSDLTYESGGTAPVSAARFSEIGRQTALREIDAACPAGAQSAYRLSARPFGCLVPFGSVTGEGQASGMKLKL